MFLKIIFFSRIHSNIAVTSPSDNLPFSWNCSQNYFFLQINSQKSASIDPSDMNLRFIWNYSQGDNFFPSRLQNGTSYPSAHKSHIVYCAGNPSAQTVWAVGHFIDKSLELYIFLTISNIHILIHEINPTCFTKSLPVQQVLSKFVVSFTINFPTFGTLHDTIAQFSCTAAAIQDNEHVCLQVALFVTCSIRLWRLQRLIHRMGLLS
jgi:hypothetical protein